MAAHSIETALTRRARMSIEMGDRPEPNARASVRGMAKELLALPGKYPVIWAVAWTVLLLVLCLAPARVFPDDQEAIYKRYLPFSDLIVHFSLFAIFAASWVRAGRWPWRWVVVPLSGIILAVGTEWAQGLPIINRDPGVLDALADVIGVFAGLAGWAILRPRPSAMTGAADLGSRETIHCA